MSDKEFNVRIEERIAKGILTPMSKGMVRDYLKYGGAMNSETKEMYESFWKLYQEGK